MKTTHVRGTEVNLNNEFIKVGNMAPDFTLIKQDMTPLSLKELKGKYVILNIFPSLDTPICATSVRKFNQAASSLPETVVLAISKDLPFAQQRFCTTEGIDNVIPVSDFRPSDFDDNYGVLMTEGPLAGLLTRAIVIIDKEGKVIYTEMVPDIAQEPDYEKALGEIKGYLNC